MAVSLLGVTKSVSAHPGNVASDGAHYCWTNCDYWGEVYGQRHYHGGGSYEPYVPEPDPDDYAPVIDPPDIDYPSGQPATNATTINDYAAKPSVTQEDEADNTWVWWVLGGGLFVWLVYLAGKNK